MRFPSASAHKITRLYHYQAFVPEYLRSVLVEHRLHFSDPRNFNDPWDCKPFYRADHLGNATALERQIEWYKATTRTHYSSLPEHEIERRASHFRMHPEQLARATMEVSREMGDAIGAQFRIYCLTPHPDSELMWAHYGGAHSGICLEFDATHPMISTALAVQYSKEFPIRDLVGTGDLADEVSPLFTKSEAWSYEEEYRLVSQERERAGSFETIVTENGSLPLPDGALKAVIIGCLGGREMQRVVLEMVAQGGRDVGVKKIVRAHDRYQLVVRDLNGPASG